jgi:hypothetical protein
MWESISTLFAIILVITVVNLVILGLVYAIVKRIPWQSARIIIPALVMLAGYLLLMKADPANLILGTHFFVLPMSVLISVFLIPGLADPETNFSRILICDFFASFIAVIVLGFFIAYQYLNTPQYYKNLAFSNGITYASVIAFDFMLAIVLFRLMRAERRYPVRAGKKNE